MDEKYDGNVFMARVTHSNINCIKQWDRISQKWMKNVMAKCSLSEYDITGHIEDITSFKMNGSFVNN